MIPLRWILVIAGLVLLAAIYVLGRRRHSNPSDRPALESASRRPGAHNLRLDEPRLDAPRTDRFAATLDNDVPQLEHAVRTRARVELPITVTREDVHNLAELPPMHADDVSDMEASSSAQGRESSKSEPSMRDTSLHEPSLREPRMGSFADISTPSMQEREPIVSDDVFIGRSAAIPVADRPSDTVTRPPRKVTSSSRKIVALRLSAASERVDGARLKMLLESAGLRHGKYSIYHRLHTDESPLFSIASMVEPGTFDPYAMSGVQFPGVTIFTQLPGPLPGEEMFAQMLACARELEQGIGGLLQDERGLPLTEQRAQRLREDVADFAHLLSNG